MISACCATEVMQKWTQFAYMVEIRMIGMTMGDDALEAHLRALPGLNIIRYVPESATEAIIEFKYKNYHFSLDNGFYMWRFFVHGDCPAFILAEIVNYCEAKFLIGN